MMDLKAETESEPPCSDLYIYYIEGRMDADASFGKSQFIGNWVEEESSFLFFSEPSLPCVEEAVARHPGLILKDHYHMTYEQWLGETFTPFSAGGLTVAPPWADISPEDKKPVLRLDPGVVFGAGTHPTTRDCLSLISEVMAADSIQSAIDLGTGTGILALAAARMGCPKILALDFNFLAARTARRNTVLNRLQDQVAVIQGRAEEYIHVSADLLIANIHYDVMEKLIGSEDFLNHRWFILSGILKSEARNVDSLLSRLSIEITDFRQRDGVWHTFCGRNLRK